MEEEYPLDSGIVEDAGSDAVEGHAVDESEIEALREKAFTPEFRELVSKITGHSGREKDIHDLSRDELLRKYHTLFYKTSNLLDYDSINSAFNQFSFHEDALFDSLCSHIQTIMEQKGFPSFAFISFDFGKSSYLPVFHTLKEIQEVSVVFDIHENFIRKIFSSKTGIFLKREEIEGDIYLRKRMECISDDPGCTYYFCAVRTIAEHTLGTVNNINHIADIAGNSAVFMVSFDSGDDIQGTGNIFDILARDLPLHLILLNTLGMKRQAAYSITGLERNISIFDYLFTIYRDLGSGSIFVLRCNDCSSRELYYTFRYLQERMKRILSGSSALMRVGADTAALFLCDYDRAAVFAVFKDHEKLFPDAVSLQEWDYNKIFHFGMS
ncbi:MAG TPA: hypothetical protein PK544_08500 [Spirochaetota bacterium]|nr:hypothetical protein [Spirochaetota bacterium]HPJ39331.1 hypothetical protein [Spirochaetota bacterium]HPQ53164.1 hypothetical protein [Spirochaetota bacterium]